MPYKNPEDRKWTKNAQAYESSPEVKAKRNARKRARHALVKEGLVSEGDGNDVQHKKSLSKGGSNARSNLEVMPSGANRSFARNGDHSLKSETSKRERGSKRK